MTVRDLINELLRFDADEEIQFFDEKEKMLKVKDIGIDPSLPYIQFKKKIIQKRY